MATQDQLTKKFVIDMKKLGKAVGVDTQTATRKVTFDAYNRITERTPVLTGYARASWMLNADSPKGNTTSPSTYPADQENQAKAKSKNRNEAKGISAVIAKRYYITNDLPYIGTLEAGRSEQMDKGYMISRTVKDMNTEAARIIKKVFG